MELDIPLSPPPIEATLAERRAKRQAILAKYAGASSTSQILNPSAGPGQGTSSAVHQPPQSIVLVSDPPSSQPHSVVGTPRVLQVNTAKLSSGLTSQLFCFIFTIVDMTDLQIFVYTGKRESMSASPTSAAFELAKDNEQEDAQVKVQAQNDNGHQISAADYDPSLDRREDEQRRVYKDEPMDVETIEEEEDEEDVDDMFAVASTVKKKVKVKKVAVSTHICRLRFS
jgi:serine/threonine-protein kinase PRP4